MPRFFNFLALVGFLLLGGGVVAPALAAEDAAVEQADPKPAYAAAYAPEAAFEECRGDRAVEAANCALKACGEASGYPEDCYVLVACDAGGWVSIMGVMLEEIHFTTASCGAPSREAAIAEMKARCAGYLPHMRECWMSRVIPLHGEGEEVSISWTAEQLTQTQ